MQKIVKKSRGYVMSKKYNFAIIVDNFQPFHNGHETLINKALKQADRVVIFIESAFESETSDNPLPYAFRSSLIKNVYGKDLEVYPLNTIKYNDVSSFWADAVIKQVEKYCDATPDLFVTDTTRPWRAICFKDFLGIDVDIVSKSDITNFEVLKMYREAKTDDDLIKITSFVPYNSYNLLTLTKAYIDASSPNVIRFIEFSGYGNDIPDLLRDYFSKHSKELYANRYGDVIAYIDERTLEVEIDDADELSETCEINRDKFVKIKGENKYFGYNEKYSFSMFSLVELSSDKKYIIETYDGSERVVELPVFKCVDSKINMYESITQN